MCIRFDDKLTREESKAASQSKAEAIGAISKVFVDGCMSSYIPGLYFTVDEHLCVFRDDVQSKFPFLPSRETWERGMGCRGS
ncbi:hypothetical protein ANN_13220 [Periplaneta americana]|uniref:Uncharacterized protein n=1 Tax=Periplaneta americana TaxID=6978 RepID=A0ABQ8TKV7_PERAM|nr:hypothetical protein ANN_13220 [Periplaneta americana]